MLAFVEFRDMILGKMMVQTCSFSPGVRSVLELVMIGPHFKLLEVLGKINLHDWPHEYVVD